MFNLIVKFDNGGLIDVESLRKDLKNDPRYFEKGAFTRSGKERLAAIEEISNVQDKGLRYNIDDKTSTFKITDKTGNKVNTEEGRGISAGKKITPFYGLVNKEKRSKKEISSILSDVKFTIPVVAEKPTAKSEVVARESKINSGADKKVSEEKKVEVKNVEEKSTPKIPSKEGSTGEVNQEQIVNSNTQQKPVTNAELDAKSKLNKDTGNPDVVPASTTPEATKPIVTPPANGSILDRLNSFVPQSPIDRLQHEDLKKDLLNVTINNSKDMSIEDFNLFQKSAKEVLALKTALSEGAAYYNNVEKVRKDLQDERTAINNSTVLSPKEKESKSAFITRKLNAISGTNANAGIRQANKDYQDMIKSLAPKYRAIMSTSFGKVITKQKEKADVLNGKLYSPSIKSVYIPEYQNSINTLEKTRNDYENFSDEQVIEKMIEAFSNITKHKQGGVVRKYQDGTESIQPLMGEDVYARMNKTLSPLESILKVLSDNGAKSGDPLKHVKSPVVDEVVKTVPGDQRVLTKKKEKLFRDATADDENKNGERFKKVGSSDGSALGKTFSSNQINTPVGSIQYNDIVQFVLLNKAHKKPVAKVKPFQATYQEKGSRNVQAARDIDASAVQAEKSAINRLESGYTGSDPVLALLAKKSLFGKKTELNNELISKRATYRRSEEDRVNSEMEQKRVQASDDLQGINANENFNREQRHNAELATAKAEVDRETAYAEGLGSMSQAIQKRWNEQAETKKQFQAGLAATARQQKLKEVATPYQDALAVKKKLSVDLKYAATPADAARIQNDLSKADEVYQLAKIDFDKVNNESEGAEKAYSDISKGSPLFDFSAFKK
jgi:hypothetical protein